MGQARIDFTNTRLDAIKAADFETLAQLAEAIWRSHHTRIIGSAQIDYMLAGRYQQLTSLLPSASVKKARKLKA
jgi:hypothetical protein